MTEVKSNRPARRRGAPAPPRGDGGDKVSPAREAAARICARVLEQRMFLDDAERLEEPLLRALKPSDRAMARRLVLETLRRLGEIDGIVDARLSHPLPDEAAGVRAILRVLAAETVFLGGAAHAAVGEAVALTKRVKPRFSSLVNAVGRKIAQYGEQPRAVSAAGAASNTPEWLREQLIDDWGAATTANVMLAHAKGAPLDLTVKNPAAAEEWAQHLGGTVTPTGSVRLGPSGAVPDLPGYDAGAWWVQDAAAALPVMALAPTRGERVLDLCAAPGGKTMQLAAAGADVVALDLSERRMRRVDQNLRRTRLPAQLIVADALQWRPQGGALFDAVLLDAPCTATGTIRRHPDLPHVKDLSDLDDLTSAQDALLDAAWALVRPGGRLVFCTCSLLHAEGEDRADAAMARWPDAQAPAFPADGPLGAVARADDLSTGHVRTTPAMWRDLGGMDGFFIARFVKQS